MYPDTGEKCSQVFSPPKSFISRSSCPFPHVRRAVYVLLASPHPNKYIKSSFLRKKQAEDAMLLLPRCFHLEFLRDIKANVYMILKGSGECFCASKKKTCLTHRDDGGSLQNVLASQCGTAHCYRRVNSHVFVARKIGSKQGFDLFSRFLQLALKLLIALEAF